MPAASLFISRTLLPAEHQRLRAHIQEVNHALPRETLRWRALGQTGVMLVQSGEYAALTRVPRSMLQARGPRKAALSLNNGALKDMSRMTVNLTATAAIALATEQYMHIGYRVDPKPLSNERSRCIEALNKMNGVPGDWRHEFQPFISVATLPKTGDMAAVKALFEQFRAETATLLPATAIAA